VTVTGVLTQAQVADHEHVPMRVLDRACGELDYAVVVPRSGALLVLGRGQPEQEYGRDPQRLGLARLADGVGDRQPVDPRHLRNRLPAVKPVRDEHWVHEVRRREARLADQTAKRMRGTEPA